MKDFIKSWKPKALKEMGKKGRMTLLEENINDITSFFVSEGHRSESREVISALHDIMCTKKFIKTLKALIDNKDRDTRIDIAFAMVINDFIEKRWATFPKDDVEDDTIKYLDVNGDDIPADIMSVYGDIGNKLLKKRIKEVVSDTGLESDVIAELIPVITYPEIVSNDKFIGIHVRLVTRKLYTLAAQNDLGLDTHKKIKKLFGSLFGKENVTFVAVAILLERKDTIRNFNEAQIAMWNALTDFALVTLEDEKKKEIHSLIVDRYIYLREKEFRKNRDGARRIQFSSLAKDTYPKIYDVYEDLSENEKFFKFL